VPADADFASVLRYSLAIAGVVLSLSVTLLFFFWRSFSKEKTDGTFLESRAVERIHIRNLALLIVAVTAACAVVFWVAVSE